jgi:type II secretory ATPase GspE/PulE/Tfp pilus assembly ATPase PilB-like protein
MGQVIDIFSRQGLERDFNSVADSYADQLIEYDPEMPIALELFVGLDKSMLLKDCWVPLSWYKNGILVLVDDPLDQEKLAAIQTVLKSEWVILAAGTKESIRACIHRSFSQLEIDEFFSNMMSGKEPVDVTKLVDILITEAYTKGASDICFESSAVSGNNRVLFWMDGVYREYMTISEAVAFDVLKRIRIIAILDAGDRELTKVGYHNIRCHFYFCVWKNFL